jgi:hypothetical protein
MDDLSCPRCGGALEREDYGPCTGCMDELRASQRRDPRVTEAAAFEPKMHVTPNAVALKD